MKSRLLPILLSLLPALAAASEPPLTCFGNEPSWGLHFAGPEAARLLLPDRPSLELKGRETRLEPGGDRAWRGRRAAGGGRDVVAFLSPSACSDGMSDTKHPVTARVSLPDGRLLAGCCRISGAGAAGVPLAPTLDGATWRLASLRGVDAGALRGAAQPVTATFKAGRVTGFSGCNRFFGGYTVERDRVTIGPLAGSMMACDEPAMALERAFQSALAGTFAYAIAGGRLTLRNDAEPVLVFEALPAPTLEGVTWKITGFNNGRQAVVSTRSGTTLTMAFARGTVTGSAGCNRFHATYTADANGIKIGPVAATRRLCPAEGVMQQEREFLAALQATTAWAVEGGQLDMHRGDGERSMTATAQ